jgi:hypothetical protein
MGTEGTLLFEGRGKLVLHPEPVSSEAQRYATICWPEAMRKQYLESFKTPPSAPPPAKEIPLDRKPAHHEYFVLSLRNGTPSREDAAGAAHLANRAYRKGRRMKWDLARGEVTEG